MPSGEAPAARNIKVVSCGGVGSKIVLGFLCPGLGKRRLEKRHLHTRVTGRFAGRKVEFVYVFGDPRDAVVSFFQRRDTRHANHNFGVLPEHPERPDPEWVVRHCRSLGRGKAAISRDWDLEDYLAHATRDVFGLRHHFKKWMAAASDLNVTFVRYETVWACQGLLRDLFDLPADAKLPARQPRRADWQALPDPQREKIDALYGPLAGRFRDLPDVFRVGSDDLIVPLSQAPAKIPLGTGGMFAMVNSVVTAAKQHEDGRVPAFAIDNSRFLYGRWEDYFAPPMEVAETRQSIPLRCFSAGFQNPRKVIPPEAMVGYEGPMDRPNRMILLPPEDRREGARIIARYIRLQPDLKREIDDEIASSGIAGKLGLHIRGAGRTHGGVGWMLFRMNHHDAPYDLYFKAADAWLERNDAGIHVFSDAREVVDKVVARYGDRVTFRAASLISEKGEGHLDDALTDKRKIGRDIIAECWMMAHARHLIHGNSNVTNFAMSLNPDLSHHDIFEVFYDPDYDMLRPSAVAGDANHQVDR